MGGAKGGRSGACGWAWRCPSPRGWWCLKGRGKGTAGSSRWGRVPLRRVTIVPDRSADGGLHAQRGGGGEGALREGTSSRQRVPLKATYRLGLSGQAQRWSELGRRACVGVHSGRSGCLRDAASGRETRGTPRVACMGGASRQA